MTVFRQPQTTSDAFRSTVRGRRFEEMSIDERLHYIHELLLQTMNDFDATIADKVQHAEDHRYMANERATEEYLAQQTAIRVRVGLRLGGAILLSVISAVLLLKALGVM